MDNEERINNILLTARNLVVCKICGTSPKIIDIGDKNSMVCESEWQLYCPNEHAHFAIDKWNKKQGENDE